MDSGFRSDGKQAVKYMQGLGIERLDCYIASHRHRNHVGGAPYIIQQMDVGTVVTADDRMRERLIGLTSGSAERAAVKAVQYRHLGVGHVMWLGSAKLTRIGPAKLSGCAAGALAENANSMILRVQYGQRSMLLTGDTSSAILLAAAKQGYDIRAEVLKNPHHNGAQSVAVLKAIAPQHIIICNSSKAAKTYQKRMKQLGAAWYTACKKGSGIVRAWAQGDGDRWNIETNQ